MRINPLVYVAEGMRGVLTPGMPHMDLRAVSAALIIIIGDLLTLGIRSFEARWGEARVGSGTLRRLDTELPVRARSPVLDPRSGEQARRVLRPRREPRLAVKLRSADRAERRQCARKLAERNVVRPRGDDLSSTLLFERTRPRVSPALFGGPARGSACRRELPTWALSARPPSDPGVMHACSSKMPAMRSEPDQ